MADIKRTRNTSTEFHEETGEQGFVPADLFKRVHVSSDGQEATSQWKLGIQQDLSNSSTAGSEISGKRKRKSDSSEDEAVLRPYECRFCPMKFAKSQALGGHMNRHRQEREREQLLHARQLVLQQGLPWVAGQSNHKIQRSTDCYSNRIPIPPSFQLSQSWNISQHLLPEGVTGISTKSNNGASGEDEETHILPRSLPTYCPQQAEMPYMVQHATTIRTSFGGAGSDMMVVPHSLEEQEQQQSELEISLEDGSKQTMNAPDFPALQLGPCSSEASSLHQMSSDVSQLQMAVDFECAPQQQLLSLGGFNQVFPPDGYRTTANSIADIMNSPQPATMACDGLSWIFNGEQKPTGVTAVPLSSSCYIDGFSLALGHQSEQEDERECVQSEEDELRADGDVRDTDAHLSLLNA